MLRHGSARWQLILFGLATASLGLLLWNGLGPKFGLGAAHGTVSRPAAIAAALLFALAATAEIVLGSR